MKIASKPISRLARFFDRILTAPLLLVLACSVGCQGQPSLPLLLEAERGEQIGETLLYLHNTSDQTIGELSFKRHGETSSPMVISTQVLPGQVARCGVFGASDVDAIVVFAEGFTPTTLSIPSVPEKDIDTNGYDFAQLPTFSLDGPVEF